MSVSPCRKLWLQYFLFPSSLSDSKKLWNNFRDIFLAIKLYRIRKYQESVLQCSAVWYTCRLYLVFTWVLLLRNTKNKIACSCSIYCSNCSFLNNIYLAQYPIAGQELGENINKPASLTLPHSDNTTLEGHVVKHNFDQTLLSCQGISCHCVH